MVSIQIYFNKIDSRFINQSSGALFARICGAIEKKDEIKFKKKKRNRVILKKNKTSKKIKIKIKYITLHFFHHVRDFGRQIPEFQISGQGSRLCLFSALFLPSTSLEEGHLSSAAPRTRSYQSSTQTPQLND